MSEQIPSILVVEDERAHQLLIQKCLMGFYEFQMAGNKAEAHQALKAKHFDIIILDIMLPDGNGFDLLTEIRQDERFRLTPVIFLTVREDLKSKLMGFSLGADDYVIKPPEPLELRARIDAKLRKMSEIRETAPMTEIRVGDLVLEVDRQSAVRTENGQRHSLYLTPLEFRLLAFFARHPDEALTRATILQSVWGEATHVLDRSVDSYVASLRRKLGPCGHMIKSVHGVGYRFTMKSKKAA